MPRPIKTRLRASLAQVFLILAAVVLLALVSPSPARAQAGTTLDLLTHLYGITSAPVLQQKDVTVGTSAAQVTKDNASRFEVAYINTGTSACTVSHSDLVTATSGTLLTASGGALVEDFRSDMLLPTYQAWAVCTASGGNIHIVELILGPR